MIKELVKLANHLDQKGLMKEADYLDSVIQKYSQSATVLNELRKVFETLSSHVTSNAESERVGGQMAGAFGEGAVSASPMGGFAGRIDLHKIESELASSITGLSSGEKITFNALQQNNDLKNPVYHVLVTERSELATRGLVESSRGNLKDAIMMELYFKLAEMSPALRDKPRKDIEMAAKKNPFDIKITIEQINLSEGRFKYFNPEKNEKNPQQGGDSRPMPVYRDQPPEAPPKKPPYRAPSR